MRHVEGSASVRWMEVGVEVLDMVKRAGCVEE